MKTVYTAVVEGEQRQISVETEDRCRYRVAVGDQEVELDVVDNGGGQYQLFDGDAIVDLLVSGSGNGVREVHRACSSVDIKLLDERELARQALCGGIGAGTKGQAVIEAPMPGRVVKCLVKVGDQVEAKQGVIVVEAMKMENELKAPAAGVIKKIEVSEGGDVESGDPLVLIDCGTDQ